MTRFIRAAKNSNDSHLLFVVKALHIILGKILALVRVGECRKAFLELLRNHRGNTWGEEGEPPKCCEKPHRAMLLLHHPALGVARENHDRLRTM